MKRIKVKGAVKMKRLSLAIIAAAALLVLPYGRSRAAEITLTPNYGVVISPDFSGADSQGGPGIMLRAIFASSMFNQYEVGIESGILPVYKYEIGAEDYSLRTIPVSGVVRYNFFALGDIKPYFIAGAGVYHSRLSNGSTETDNSFGASGGLGAKMVSPTSSFFLDGQIGVRAIFNSDFADDDILSLFHIGIGAGMTF
ncbi:MAG: outer membrane beta-barrel protein [Elusimicrobiota bacterium]